MKKRSLSLLFSFLLLAVLMLSSAVTMVAETPSGYVSGNNYIIAGSTMTMTINGLEWPIDFHIMVPYTDLPGVDGIHIDENPTGATTGTATLYVPANTMNNMPIWITLTDKNGQSCDFAEIRVCGTWITNGTDTMRLGETHEFTYNVNDAFDLVGIEAQLPATFTVTGMTDNSTAFSGNILTIGKMEKAETLTIKGDVTFSDNVDRSRSFPITIEYPEMTVTGKANVGNTLKANLSYIPDGCDAEYKWSIDGETVGTDAEYTCKKEDVGKTVSLDVKINGTRCEFDDEFEIKEEVLPIIDPEVRRGTGYDGLTDKETASPAEEAPIANEVPLISPKTADATPIALLGALLLAASAAFVSVKKHG